MAFICQVFEGTQPTPPPLNFEDAAESWPTAHSSVLEDKDSEFLNLKGCLVPAVDWLLGLRPFRGGSVGRLAKLT